MKLTSVILLFFIGVSLPTRERELKSYYYDCLRSHNKSLPTRERELKSFIGEGLGGAVKSLPTRERELKYEIHG